MKGAFGQVKIMWFTGKCTDASEEITVIIPTLFIYLIPLLFIVLNVCIKYFDFQVMERIFSYKLDYLFLPRLFYYLADGHMSIGSITAFVIYVATCLIITGSSFLDEKNMNASVDQAMLIASGQFSLLNFWLALLLSSKTSLLSKLIGIPFERRIKYHKAIVSLAMISGLVHVILNDKINRHIFYSYEEYGSSEAIPIYGLISYFLFSAMTLLAFEPIRRASYELFMLFHYLYIPAIGFLILHVEDAYVGFIPGLIFQCNFITCYI